MLTFLPRGPRRQLEGYPPWLATLLGARGITTPEEAARFLAPSLSQLHDPFLLADMGKACELIHQAQAQQWPVVVYGDYDADGLCACAILVQTLRRLGIQADSYIPRRHSEGYGLNQEAVRALAQSARLLITVDCGIANVQEIALARELGLRVIVTDHHALPEALPQADAVIHPLLGDYPDGRLCGAGVAWKLCQALAGEAYAQTQLDLAALATIADMVPLQGENRVIARFGLEKLSLRERVGLRALLESAGIAPTAPIGAERVAFAIAPRLNACGRLEDAQDALQLLLTDDGQEAASLAARLNTLNTQRRSQEEQVLQQAQQQLLAQDLFAARSIVVQAAGWNSGVVGLAAGKLAEKYGYPTLVFSQGEDISTGSGRSAAGMDLYAALKACAPLLERFGGHPQAAGMSIKTAKLPQLRACFDAAVRAQTGDAPLTPRVLYDDVLALEDVTPELVARLEALAPFGIGNPAPLFLQEEMQVKSCRAVGEGKHLKLELADATGTRSAIYFGGGTWEKTMPPAVNAVFRPGINEYMGRTTVQCEVRALLAGREAFSPNADAEALALLQDLQAALANCYAAAAVQTTDTESLAQADCPPGTLLFCRSQQSAKQWRTVWPQVFAATGALQSPQAASAVVYRAPLHSILGPYRRIVFCDGLVCPQEAALAQALYPKAQLLALPPGGRLAQIKAALRVSREELRLVYMALRDTMGMRTLPLSRPQQAAAMAILRELGLAVYDGPQGQGSLRLSNHKSDPQQSRLFCLLST